MKAGPLIMLKGNVVIYTTSNLGDIQKFHLFGQVRDDVREIKFVIVFYN